MAFHYKYIPRTNTWKCSYDENALFVVSDEEVVSYGEYKMKGETTALDTFKMMCADVIMARMETFNNQFVVRSFLMSLFK